MAKKSSRGRGRKSRNVDWVVNEETYGSVVALPNGSQVLLALTQPKFAVGYTDPTFAITYPAYQFPEQDSGQVVYAVRGQVSLSPGTWAAGSVMRMMMRLIKKPEEYANVQQAIIDPNYSLFQAEFANERFLWQHYLRESFNLGSPFFEMVNISWKGVCKLEPDEALWLAIENQSGVTQTINVNPFCRTLMRADG